MCHSIKVDFLKVFSCFFFVVKCIRLKHIEYIYKFIHFYYIKLYLVKLLFFL